MQIRYNLYSPSFKKSLVATCKVKSNSSNNSECKIYQLDPKKDTDYFLKLDKHPDWQDASLTMYISQELNEVAVGNKKSNLDFYSMENKKGECIGYCELVRTDKNFFVEVLETIPKHSKNNEERKVKYIGETFLSFLANLAKKNDVSKLSLTSSEMAYDFYIDKCFFKDFNKEDRLVTLDKQDYDKLISQNEEHCGGVISFCG